MVLYLLWGFRPQNSHTVITTERAPFLIMDIYKWEDSSFSFKSLCPILLRDLPFSLARLSVDFLYRECKDFYQLNFS